MTHILKNLKHIVTYNGLVTSLPRSINGYICNYLFALLSFVLA